MSETSNHTPLNTVFLTLTNQSLPTVWQRLHDNNASWALMHRHDTAKKNLKAIDQIDLKLLESLQTCPADRWMSLCAGAGQTQIGAVGLSWCSGAILSDVWRMWAFSKTPFTPDDVNARPARLLNPSLLGDVNKLSMILDTFRADSFLACVHIIRAGPNFQLDLDPVAISSIPQEIAMFIFEALRQRGETDDQYLKFTRYRPEFSRLKTE